MEEEDEDEVQKQQNLQNFDIFKPTVGEPYYQQYFIPEF
jgi:hypothetical protein